MALGADRSDVLMLFLGQGMRLVGMGLALGLLVALVATRLARDLLYGVGPNDPLTFAMSALIVALVALVAILHPANRATAVDPVEPLRYE
jgi:putative ABC transport system permease protein